MESKIYVETVNGYAASSINFERALNNLWSVYVDCGELDLAADCYINALKTGHTRAHQGLARVHFLKNEKAAAYDEMTKLIKKAKKQCICIQEEV
ncbi:hypothetical protein QQ045_002155 [Rhodiola kirilowii]